MSQRLSDGTTELLADVFNRMFSVRKSLDDAKRIVKLENLDLNILFDLLDEDNKQFVTTRDVDWSDGRWQLS